MLTSVLLFFTIGLIFFFYFMLRYYQKVQLCPTSTTQATIKTTSIPSTQPTGTPTSYTESGRVVFATIQSDRYQPRNILVRPNMTVIWTNMDSEYHSVTSLQGSELRSSILKFKEQHAHTFRTPGTYIYYDTINPFIMGTVHVKDEI